MTSAALVDCVRKVARGETWVQDVAVPSELTENDMVGLRVRDRLTAKELRIVALIVQGYKNKEIATQLGTTEQVIKNYLRNVYDKIGVSDRLELALFTIHHRILNEAAAATTAGRSSAASSRCCPVSIRIEQRPPAGGLFYLSSLVLMISSHLCSDDGIPTAWKIWIEGSGAEFWHRHVWRRQRVF